MHGACAAIETRSADYFMIFLRQSPPSTCLDRNGSVVAETLPRADFDVRLASGFEEHRNQEVLTGPHFLMRFCPANPGRRYSPVNIYSGSLPVAAGAGPLMWRRRIASRLLCWCRCRFGVR